MKFMIKKQICPLLLALILIFFTAGYAQAQSIGIKISPPRLERIIDPGMVAEETISVTNESDVEKTLFIYLKDFKAEDESGEPALISPGSEEGYYLASWIEATAEGIHFAPREEKRISFKINVPADIGPGGYYGAVFFGTEPPRLYQDSEDKGAGMAVSQQTGSLILYTVRGDISEEAGIREFTTDKELYSTPYAIDFTIRIENTGNVHVKPFGLITIRSMFGKKVGEVMVNEKGSNVMPVSIRRFNEIWEGKTGFGRYTAELGLTFGTAVDKGGQGKQTLYTEKTFWIMPWKIVVPAGISFILFFVLAWLFLRFYKSKAVKRALAQAGIGQVRYIRKYSAPSPFLHFGLIFTALLVISFLIGTIAYFLFFA